MSDLATERIEEFDWDGEGGDVDLAEVGLGFDGAVAFFEGGEGDGAGGMDHSIADWFAGLGVET